MDVDWYSGLAFWCCCRAGYGVDSSAGNVCSCSNIGLVCLFFMISLQFCVPTSSHINVPAQNDAGMIWCWTTIDTLVHVRSIILAVEGWKIKRPISGCLSEKGEKSIIVLNLLLFTRNHFYRSSGDAGRGWDNTRIIDMVDWWRALDNAGLQAQLSRNIS